MRVSEDYYSEDSSLKASVLTTMLGEYMVDFFKNGEYLQSRTYYGRSKYFVNDVAENYCSGILKL